MPFFLDDADEQYQADDCDHAQIDVNGHQAIAARRCRRGQGRDDGDRVDQAFVEHAEDEIDDEQRCDVRIGVLFNDAPNAWAFPWKPVCSESGG